MAYHWGSLTLCSIYLLLLVPVSGYILQSFHNSSEPLCYKHESLALLYFKNSTASYFHDECMNTKAKTESWKRGTDCCEWDGVICDSLTGYVIELDLSCSQLGTTIESNSTLFQLQHLRTLNLAFNYFIDSSNIPPEFGHFQYLTQLNLSNSYFQGKVPSEFSNLQKLVSLDLSSNYDLQMPNFKYIIQNLTSLARLELDSVSINSEVPEFLGNRSLLTHLSLPQCSLKGKFPSTVFDLPHLQVLRLGYNNDLYLDQDMMHSHNWSNSLEILDLTLLDISSRLSSSLGRSKPLKELYLRRCNLYGPIEPWLWNTTTVIDLSYNHFSGSLPSRLNSAPSLVEVYLMSNNFSGSIELNMFSKSKDLQHLDLSNCGLSVIASNTGEINSTLVWPELQELSLSSCNITEFPSLRPPEYLSTLDLSNNNIQGEIPKWLNEIGKLLTYDSEFMISLNLSHNLLTHGLKNLPWEQLSSLDVSSNILQEPIPVLPESELYDFYASNNRLNGTINPSICNLGIIELIDLSNNTLSGELPRCLGDSFTSLVVLNLQSNRLNGTIPENSSTCNFLQYLDLSYNQLDSVVPKSLSQCLELSILNLENNKLEGIFPSWLDTLPNLQVLILRFNRFHGLVRVSSSQVKNPFPKLQILDISNNNFSGTLPTDYIKGFVGMKELNESSGSPQYLWYSGFGSLQYSVTITLTFNGVQLNYQKIITTMATFDLSNNKFEGDIPEAIGTLKSLRGLNLSHNYLTGSIPSSIGKLSLLNCLDFSSNRLTGHIPQELVSLTFLEVFDVSDNQLVGTIPHGNNFDTFSADSYQNNHGLCGQPLSNCGKNNMSSANNTRSQVDGSEDESILPIWEIITMGFGSGVVIGLAWGYYVFSVGKPFWFIRLAYKMEMALLDFCHHQFCRRASKRAEIVIN